MHKIFKTGKATLAVLIVSSMLFAWFAVADDSRTQPQSKGEGGEQLEVRESETVKQLRKEADSRLISISSCASNGCHGMPGQTTGDMWRQSYIVWAKEDPHAHAWQTLWNDQSTEILSVLFHAESRDRKQEFTQEDQRRLIQERCASCHSTNDQAATANAGEGVSCQSCHGEAKDWVAAHTLADWPDRPAASKHELGFVDQSDVVSRVRNCARCHIGNAEQDMNHDLIAAGHPRLFFDFTSHMRRLPRHWDESSLPKHDWSEAQVESTRAAIVLLQQRARRFSDGQANSVWPEFAEYDCLNCHHGLNRNWYDVAKVTTDGHGLGNLSWGNWYVPEHVWPAVNGETSQSATPIDALRKEMNRPQPDPKVISQLAAEVEESLQSPGLDIILNRLPAMDWESVAHWYYAALAKSREPAFNRIRLIDDSLAALRVYLNIPFDDDDTGRPVGMKKFSSQALLDTITDIQQQFGMEQAK